MVEMSPRLSFKGYKFSMALYRNIDTVKGLVAIIAGYSYLTGFQWEQFVLALSASVIGLAGKLLADAVDYFFKEVEIK